MTCDIYINPYSVILVIVIVVMDLGLLYSDFVMDNRELILHTANQMLLALPGFDVPHVV